MSSVGGVFLEKEINGKPFHMFMSFLSETDNSSSSSSPSLSGEEAIDSGGGDNDPSLQTRFICHNSRYQLESRKHEHLSDDCSFPVGTSPHFNKEVVDQINCKHPVLPLFWCNNEKSNDVGSHIECGACQILEVGSGYSYFCETCNKVYHKECVEAPLLIKKHPSYPSFSSNLWSNLGVSRHRSCFICETEMIKQMGYFSPTHNVVSHMVCLLKPIPITVDHFKRHPHPLTLFPKQASLACDICGMIRELIPTYICAPCVFVVHRDCIYFPYVIRISRHHHRISFTYPPLPSGNLSCGVCRRKIDNSCGAYSCNNCDGSYFVHTRCALRKDVWDGEELEGTPEELEIVEDPFQTVADGEIIHFSHGHHRLKLEICRDYDEDKYCQGCVLPIYQGNYYSCVDDSHCDFILHETCANAPRKIRHPLHAHSLTLKVVTNEYDDNKGFFRCNACLRPCNGFVYEEESTEARRFRLDLRCASISEPFKYEGHDHPLFLALSPDEEVGAKCHICRNYKSSYYRKLNCIKCDDYVVCFECATLPYKAKYKHDKHFLTFRKELVKTDQTVWCEACEKKILYPEEWGFYACDEYCCTTLHVDCLLGEEPYMKHGQIISCESPFHVRHNILARVSKCHILRNNTMTRPFCHNRYRCPFIFENNRYRCQERCRHKVYFKLEDLTFCSYHCLNPSDR